MESNLHVLKTKAYTIVYGGLFAIFVAVIVLSSILPLTILGTPKVLLLFVLAVIVWYALLIKAVPKCQNCGMGFFSLIEIGSFPVVIRPWVGNTCSSCGAPLK